MSESEYRVLVSSDGFGWKHSLVLYHPGGPFGNAEPSTLEPTFSTEAGVQDLRAEYEKMGEAFSKPIIELVRPSTAVVFHPIGVLTNTGATAGVNISLPAGEDV